jgi:adenine C2-methylase RlmN of 23S rRNA A2503 and tRNA A37
MQWHCVCCQILDTSLPALHVQGVSLALSLHAPNQELRQQIVPSARAYKLDKLMAAVDKYMAASKQKVTQQLATGSSN